MEDSIKYSGILKKWWLKFQQYKVGYKNGVYHLNCLVNSPNTIVESLGNMPFSSIDRENQHIKINTLFANSSIYYSNPEEGLWVLNYHNYYKKTLLIKNIFDEAIPMEHSYIHFLSTKGNMSASSMVANGVSIKENMWSMAKIGQPRDSLHYKDTTELSTVVFFTMDWLKKNEFLQNTIQLFFESNGKHLVIHNSLDTGADFYTQFTQLLQKEKNHQTKMETIELTKRFVKLFSFSLDEQKLSPAHFLLLDNDWKRVLSVEYFLKENLFNDFPSIETIAKKVNISPTKLKTDFKIVYQKTIYTYFQELQMDIAHHLLYERAYKVKDVADLLHYKNTSKFTAVFKKRYGILPSDLSRDSTKMIDVN